MTSRHPVGRAVAGAVNHSLLWVGTAAIALIAAGYLWQQLRHERQKSANASATAMPVRALDPPSSTMPVAQLVAPVAKETPSQPGDLTASPPVVSASYSREFERMFRNERPDRDYSNIAALHSAMERESRDAIWATERERDLRALYSSRTELVNYDIPTIECRSSMCEIRLLARGVSAEELSKALKGPNATPAEDGAKPKMVLTDMDSQNGITALVVHVSYGSVPTGLPPPPAAGGGSAR